MLYCYIREYWSFSIFVRQIFLIFLGFRNYSLFYPNIDNAPFIFQIFFLFFFINQLVLLQLLISSLAYQDACNFCQNCGWVGLVDNALWIFMCLDTLGVKTEIFDQLLSFTLCCGCEGFQRFVCKKHFFSIPSCIYLFFYLWMHNGQFKSQSTIDG